jgi:DNA gyrase subunit B
MEENLKALSEKDQVREKISVWLGSNNHNAVIHCVEELVGNSEDEINKGKGDTIEIVLEDEKTVTITDNCQGLPVEGMGEREIEGVGKIPVPRYKLLTEVLFAGTKYDNGLDGNEDYTVGTNGVFLTVLTRSSQYVKYEIARPDRNIYYFDYIKGKENTPIKVIGKSDKTYTKITYSLDDDVFEDNCYTYEELCRLAKEKSSLINGKIIVKNASTNEVNIYQYTNGIIELLEDYTKELNTLSEPLVFNKTVEKFIEKKQTNDVVKFDMVFQYSKEDEVAQIEFLNGSNLINHGTIYDGIIAGMKSGFNKFIKDSGLYQKNEKQISNDDVMTGLNYIINFKSYFPIFENQTKFATKVVYYKDIMKETLEHYLEVLAVENKELMLKMANQILLNKRVREKATDSRQKLRKELEGQATNASNRPEKFVPCRSKDKTLRRLKIIEGDSALIATKLSRDKLFDAIFPLKGKLPNCLKKSIDDILKNDEIRNLIKLCGAGVTYKGKSVKGLPKFNIDNFEFAEIDVLTDADEDGFHIRCLVIAMFYMLMPDMIKHGRLRILEAPLYRITVGKEEYVAYDEVEKNKIISSLKGKKVTEITRFKGLGGLNPQLMAKTVMSMDNRRVKEVTMDNVEEAVKYLEMFMDDDSEDRKEFIKQHGHEYFDYSIYED